MSPRAVTVAGLAATLSHSANVHSDPVGDRPVAGYSLLIQFALTDGGGRPGEYC